MGQHVVVIGAGMGGLAAAIELAGAGLKVTLLEQADAPGGKMREVVVEGQGIDSGPTVFTMRWVFDGLLDCVGRSLEALVSLTPCEVLARHAWRSGGPMDLFHDLERTVDEIGRFSGAADAASYREFCARTARIFNALRDTYIAASRPSMVDLVLRVGPHRLGTLLALGSFESMWHRLRRTFHDERLQQLFGRYATYCGSSPFQTPATLLLVAHVEREGVWMVDGGMHQLAQALARTAAEVGAAVRYGEPVAEIIIERDRVAGVRTARGERIACDAVVCNADKAAIAEGRFGAAVAAAVPGTPRAQRSLSAVTWSMRAGTAGFPLTRHNVFFSDDYRAEFDALYGRRRLPVDPTVYVCAQDRGSDAAADSAPARERLLCLVNAPADGDRRAMDETALARYEEAAFGLLRDCGLTIERTEAGSVQTAPQDFARLFPATGGALYGPNLHGMLGSFRRPGARSRVPGLYLSGGSVHPGAGVPMATLSGRIAAAAVLADRPAAHAVTGLRGLTLLATGDGGR